MRFKKGDIVRVSIVNLDLHCSEFREEYMQKNGIFELNYEFYDYDKYLSVVSDIPDWLSWNIGLTTDDEVELYYKDTVLPEKLFEV